MDLNLDEIHRKLQSSDLMSQLSGMDDAKTLIEQLVRGSVEVLLNSPNRYVVAEKLFAMGGSVIPELEQQLRNGGDPEAMAYVALILLKLGSRSGVARLLQSLKDGVGPTGMIAQALGIAAVPGASAAITDVLNGWPVVQDPYTVVTLISALRALDAPEPYEILEKLEVSAPQIRRLL